jgi:Mce-associated membrane protein
VPAQQPVRRPRVAGLRHPEVPRREDQQPAQAEPEQDTQVIPKITDEPEPSPRPRPKRQPAADSKPGAQSGAVPETAAEVTAQQPTPPWLATENDHEDGVDDGAPARRGVVTPVVLAVVVVLIGGLAAWFGVEWADVRSSAAASNTAITDNATTAAVNGQISAAVNQTFSFDYTNLGKTQRAVQQVLTGSALCQYNALFKQVQQQAPSQKLVLTTTVQKEGVELLQGDAARVLLLVQQHDTRATTNQTSDSQSMIAVNAVRQGGTWKISAIDTFSGTSPTPNCKS